MDCQRLKGLLSLIKDDMLVNNIGYYKKDFYELITLNTNKASNTYSLSKNIISICIGILIDEGKLTLNDDIGELFIDEYEEASSYFKVAIKDVLMQVTGIKEGFLDIDVENPKLYPSDDYLKMIFDRGIHYKDKTHFVYSDSNYYLLGRVVSKVSGIPLDRFIIERILEPLSIFNYDFQYDPLGYQMGATGVFLDSLEVCKIASIFLNKGRFLNQQIVSSEYIDEAMKEQVIIDEHTSYGYSIWTNRDSGLKHGSGMLGQLFVLYKDEIISFLSYDLSGSTNALKDYLLKKEV